MANYAFTTGRYLPEIEDGHTFEKLNFTQMLPHTKIFVGKSGLKFVSCNLTNCDPPADAEIVDCLLCHWEYCTHAHPTWILKGLSECAEDCSHLVETDTITIDGVVVDAIKQYADKAVQ